MNTNYESYAMHNRKITLLANASSILNLDSVINLPEEASDTRSEQVWILSEIIYNLSINEEYIELCNKLSREELDEIRKKNVEISVKDIIKKQKLSAEFVKAEWELLSLSENTYYKARKDKNFADFAPFLEKVVAHMRRKAELLWIKWTYYNTLLDEYDEWLTEEYLEPVFEKIKSEVLPIIKKLYAQKKDEKKIKFSSDEKKNIELFKEILAELGYNLKRWWVISCPASYMIWWNPMDTRMMIRDSGKIQDMIGSVIHEWWHWIYEQWFNPDYMWLPINEPTSYTIHESQSRLYELHIWNSKDYQERILDYLKKYYPEDTKDINLDDMYLIANQVWPVARRVESDEISYHVHIMIRFEIEKDLINWKIEVKDVPALWNEKYKEYLGIEFKDEWEWVLQDIHWAWGNFGYFPTYSLWTFYSAQFFAKMEEEIPDMKNKIKSWELWEIKEWLNKKVHSHWRLKTSSEILKYATWKDIDIDIFIKHIKQKYSELYNIEL